MTVLLEYMTALLEYLDFQVLVKPVFSQDQFYKRDFNGPPVIHPIIVIAQ